MTPGLLCRSALSPSFSGSVPQVDNQLLGSTQPVMLCVTPNSSESTMEDSGPALQVNAVKVPSSLMLTELFKVNPDLRL